MEVVVEVGERERAPMQAFAVLLRESERAQLVKSSLSQRVNGEKGVRLTRQRRRRRLRRQPLPAHAHNPFMANKQTRRCGNPSAA